MSNGNRRKRKLRKASIERHRINNKRCTYIENGKVCGKYLRGTVHHWFCNKHWKIMQIKKYGYVIEPTIRLDPTVKLDPVVKLKKVYVSDSVIRI